MKEQMIKIQPERFTSVVTPRFLLRIGGLPINAVEALRFERTVQWQHCLLNLEHLMKQQKDRLVDVLHKAVSIHRENQALRRRLIQLKRDVFNMRMPRDIHAVHELTALLKPAESALLSQWLDLWDRYQDQLASGPRVLADELQLKRHLLKQTIKASDFRKGVLLSSPALDQAIDSYLASDHLSLNREQRTVERSLLEYLWRTACKTSPFSTFTSVSLGTFEQGQATGEHAIDLEITDMRKQSFTRLNMIVLSQISLQLLANEQVREALPVQLTNDWRLQDQRVRYVRRKPNLGDSEDAAVSLNFVQEHVIVLPVGPLLNHLLAFLGDGHEKKLGEVMEHLSAQSQGQGTREEIGAYLQHLLRLGFLIVPALQIDIHHASPLTAYCQGLRTIGVPHTEQLAAQLEVIESLVNAYASVTLDERRILLAEIRRRLQWSCAEVGPLIAPLPRTLLYEDTAIFPRRLTISQDGWQDVLASVSELQQLLPVFDRRLSEMLMTRGYFQTRYGRGARCDDFLSFADTFNVEFLRLLRRYAGHQQSFDSEGNLKGTENYFGLPEIEALDRARQTVARSISRAYEQLPSNSYELVLSDDFSQAIIPLIPPVPTAIQSHTFLAQFGHVDGKASLIPNQIYSGLTLMFSRFAHCFSADERAAMVPTLRATLAQLQPPGAVFAELKGGHDATNLNLHPGVTEYELVCPGELSLRPLQEQIPLKDLSIQDESTCARLRLYSQRLGKEVIPLYLGFLMPLALPEIQQILLNFSCLTTCALDPWAGVKVAPRDAAVTFYPRLRYKQVVLERAKWQILPEHIPRRTSEQSDSDFYLAIARWRKELGLPRRSFFTPSRPASIAANSEPELVSYKPLYVDFENYFSVLLLEAATRKLTVPFFFTEMLPLPEQLWLKHGAESYVSELAFEMHSSKRRNDDE